MRSCILVTVVFTLSALASTASAVDFEEYARLVEQSNSAHELLEGASPDLLPALQANAVDRDAAVIEWLDTFFASEEFSALPAQQQALAYQDRYRNEYNASRLLIALDRCEEARDRVRSLLDSQVNDPELRPRLTATYDEAIACINRPRTAILFVNVTPGDASLLVDGEFVGLASAEHDVPVGEHTLTIRADGYLDYDDSFVATAEGERVEVGPLTLIAAPSESVPPTWYEWSLWGVGAAGIAVGIIYFISANNKQDALDNPPPGHVVVDPEKEQNDIDSMRTLGWVFTGIGVASAVTGTVLYFVRRGKVRSGGQAFMMGPTMIADRPGLFMTVEF